MASFKPHPSHSGKPKNQGSAGSAHVQSPKTSKAPAKGGEAPTTPQNKRGYHPGGTRGSK